MARRLALIEDTNVQEKTSWTLWSNAKEQLKRGVQNEGVIWNMENSVSVNTGSFLNVWFWLK